MKKIQGIKNLKWLFMVLLLLGSFQCNVLAGEPSEWARDEIQNAQEEGLYRGDYSYQKNITRLEYAKLMIELVESSVEYQVDTTVSNPFIDTRDPAVLQAYRLGFIKGKSTRIFDPYAFITREEMCVMLIRVIDYVNEELQMNYGIDMIEREYKLEDLFADYRDISTWAFEAVEKAYNLKILKGIRADQIGPKNYASIEQAMVFLLRGFTEIRQIILAKESQEVPFALVEDQIVLRLNERDSMLLEAKKYAVAPEREAIYFVDDLLTFEHGSIDYLSPEDTGAVGVVGSQIRIEADGVNKDETDQFTLYIRYGEENLSVPVTVIVLDINNEAPVPSDEKQYQVNEGESISILASELATDSDGDVIRIKSYNRITKSFGLSTLVNGENQSLFQFTADQVDQNEVQEYEMILTDGYIDLSITLQITVLNKQ